MINLSVETCYKIKRARREAKLSQSELAAEVGCLQSALSMFEQGQPTKLNDEVVEKLAKKFNIPLEDAQTTQPAAVSIAQPHYQRTTQEEVPRGFCPNPGCPSNKPYQVDGRSFLLPDRAMADPIGGRFCAMCGEIIEKCCPNCRAPVHAGGVCSHCGEPYIAIS